MCTILKDPYYFLHTPCVPVDPLTLSADITSESWKFLKEFADTLLAYPKCLGLAANQVGDNRRIICMKADGELLVLINPEVTNWGKHTELGEEGCMSCPGVVKVVRRYKRITVDCLDYSGQPKTYTFNKLSARIFQHELDHLNGITLVGG